MRNAGVDERKDIDQALSALGGNAPVDDTVIRPDSRRAPEWWKGDNEAANTSIEAARNMGFVVGNIG